VKESFYNENEAYAVEWLKNLSSAGHIAAGKVDSRSIREVCAADVREAPQAHFFAGVGGWSYALRLAGWPDEASVWTGSCPCQPFSASGRKKGFADDRHLWPVWFELIKECRPAIIFGEQVASPDSLKWLDLVFSDLERAEYACGASDLCAAGIGAPHLRQRLYFAAISGKQRRKGERIHLRPGKSRPTVSEAARGGAARELGDSERNGLERSPVAIPRQGETDRRRRSADPSTAGAWEAVDWLPCSDGKARPVESGTFPLANGVPARVGKLRAYGNAVVPQAAAVFVRAVMPLI
jgi:DNA (cytosine-5)-methyltransferase 1